MGKAIFLTDENLNLSTGGVQFASSLIKALNSNYDEVEVFSVCNEEESRRINRSFYLDVLARVFFQSSVSCFSIFKFLRIVKSFDHVYFHSGKHWFLIAALRLFCRKVKIICISDNIEYDLFSFADGARSSLEKVIRGSSEYISYNLSDTLTFITSCDYVRARGLYFISKRKNIIPISVDFKRNPFSFTKFDVALFTGSFMFKPNVSALNVLIGKYNFFKENGVRVIVSGYGLSKVLENYSHDYSDVFDFVCSPSDYEMSSLFEKSDFYISPVSEGSGMKTKIAEAMSFGLPVISTKSSMIGYEYALENLSDCFFLVQDDLQDIEAAYSNLKLSSFNESKFYMIKNAQYIEYSIHKTEVMIGKIKDD